MTFNRLVIINRPLYTTATQACVEYSRSSLHSNTSKFLFLTQGTRKDVRYNDLLNRLGITQERMQHWNYTGKQNKLTLKELIDVIDVSEFSWVKEIYFHGGFVLTNVNFAKPANENFKVNLNIGMMRADVLRFALAVKIHLVYGVKLFEFTDDPNE